MEFSFEVAPVFGIENRTRCFSKLSGEDVHRLHAKCGSSSIRYSRMTVVIDSMGRASQLAQGLAHQITTCSKFQATFDQRLYVAADGSQCLGILRVGPKKLFHRMMNGDYREIQPLCVLDFYVHESCQRQGIGFELFAFMLESEEESPHNLGYDRPSPKLLSFLRKQFNLASYAQQANNFVVFNQYFDSKTPKWKRLKESSLSSSPSEPSTTVSTSSSASFISSSVDNVCSNSSADVEIPLESLDFNTNDSSQSRNEKNEKGPSTCSCSCDMTLPNESSSDDRLFESALSTVTAYRDRFGGKLPSLVPSDDKASKYRANTRVDPRPCDVVAQLGRMSSPMNPLNHFSVPHPLQPSSLPRNRISLR